MAASMNVVVKLSEFDVFQDMCNAFADMTEDERIPADVREEYRAKARTALNKYKEEE